MSGMTVYIGFMTKKRFVDLTEPEILALAISAEEEDSHIYASFANRVRTDYPSTAQMFDDMSAEEQEHKNMLLELFRAKFGDKLPYITRADVSGFFKRDPLWLAEHLRIETVRRQAEMMELESATFYAKAAKGARDVDVRKLLGDLSLMERGHEAKAFSIEQEHLHPDALDAEGHAARRLFVLQIVQPGLAGLIDGSVSTLAPIFAAAFATHNTWETFLIGMAASVGAGISMGLTEALSDDGAITGRGSPWLRGVVCGIMTTIGGLGHTLPYLITDFWTATAVAGVVVVCELVAIAWIRWKYMDTPFHSAIVQIVLGGFLVLLAGVMIGSG
jgi:rubrerythrin